MDINAIYKIESVLTPTELEGFRNLCDNYVWKFANISYDGARTFWSKDLWGKQFGKSKEIELGFRKKLEEIFDVKLETVELYLNGQAHGQCGSMHCDFKQEWDPSFEYITMVYYVNEEWKPEYGGFTCVYDANENLHIVYPKPNSAVIFNSKFNHVGLEPTVHYTGQRVTLAHKFKVLK